MRQNIFYSQTQGSEYRYLNPALSKSGKSFEQYSDTSSIINGAPVGDITRQLPPPPNGNFETKSNQYLPIGIGQFSNISYAGYSKLISQMEAEQQYRIQTMFLNNAEKMSGMSKECESMPTFTFQNDEGSLKSIPTETRNYPVFGSYRNPENSSFSQFSSNVRPLKIGKVLYDLCDHL